MALICALAGFGYGLVLDFYTWLGYSDHTARAVPRGRGHRRSSSTSPTRSATSSSTSRSARRWCARCGASARGMDVSWGPPSACGAAGRRGGRARAGCVAWRALRRPRSPAAAALRRRSSAAAAVPRRRRRGRATCVGGPESRRRVGAWRPGRPANQEATALGGDRARRRAAARRARDRARARRWMRAHLDQLQGPGDLERTILALAAARAPLGTLVARLERDRRRDGSFGEQANLTAFAILALRAAGARRAPRSARVARRASRTRDGGFSFARARRPQRHRRHRRRRSRRWSRRGRRAAVDRARARLPARAREPRRRLPARAGRRLQRAVDGLGGAGAARRRRRRSRARSPTCARATQPDGAVAYAARRRRRPRSGSPARRSPRSRARRCRSLPRLAQRRRVDAARAAAQRISLAPRCSLVCPGRAPRASAAWRSCPTSSASFGARGVEVVVEAGAGAGAMIPDALYERGGRDGQRRRRRRCGARRWSSRSRRRARRSARGWRRGAVADRVPQPARQRAGDARARRAPASTAFAMEAIPRITRAQAMDALSSQSNVAGYRAALLAAEHIGRFFPMLMTAAGTIPPAKVLVLGAGVAGLQALATARRLGAQTTGYDVRPEVAEQVQSLGAQLARPRHRGGRRGRLRARAHGGGARRPAAGADRRDQGLRRRDHDRRWCPGRPAPKLVTAEAVEGMRRAA